MAVSNVLPASTIPRPSIRKAIEELSHQKISACYQCQKCTNGCPASFAMDIAPHRVMHLLQLGMIDEVMRSGTIWACASCQTCGTRCPNGIDVARVMEELRRLSQRAGEAAEKNPAVFNSEFLGSVKSHGRLYELGMITRYTLMSEGIGGLIRQTGLAYRMFIRGKLRLLPHSVRPNPEVKTIFERAKRRENRK